MNLNIGKSHKSLSLMVLLKYRYQAYNFFLPIMQRKNCFSTSFNKKAVPRKIKKKNKKKTKHKEYKMSFT